MCTEQCGGGTKTRTRGCNKPNPSNGGAPCSGLAEEVEDCNMDICIGKFKT